MLGLIGALAEETELLRDSLENRELFQKAGLQIYRGSLRGVPAVVTCAGVGKVNAAMCAQILISEMGVDTLINTGVAGGVAPGVRQGDVIVSTDAMYHDFDATALGFPLGEIAHMERSIFPADERLQELAMAAVCCLRAGTAGAGWSVEISLFKTGKKWSGCTGPLALPARRWRGRPLPMWPV